MRKVTRILTVVLFTASIVGAPVVLSANECFTYYNSRMIFVYEYGNICAGASPNNCTECVGEDGTVCVIDWDDYCIPGQPLNQTWAFNHRFESPTGFTLAGRQPGASFGGPAIRDVRMCSTKLPLG